MFGSTKTDIGPPHQDAAPADGPVPISSSHWICEVSVGYLIGRNIPVVVDDIGRDAISRDAARQLFTEHRENQLRAQEVAARQEQKAVEEDRRFRAALYRGQPWHELPVGVSAAEAWAAADRAARPKRTSVFEDSLSHQGTVFHPISGTPDEE